ncbi:hypothetical protein RUM43_001314 [Polyplax serrata]|uniref:Intimal thickness related receptor IRP domain-containing protein n=1 Tax=Polyplax serrata TaxID=468196 RepID=A0AAN8XPI9_POLSC
MFVKIIVPLVVLAVLERSAEGKYVQGHLITHENWAFVARFCFLSEAGLFEYNIEYDEDRFGTVNLLLYYDAESQWPAVYKTNKTCSEKEAVLKVQQNQIVNLTSSFFENGCRRLKGQTSGKSISKGGGMVSCSNAKRFRSSRERWWFIAFSNCNSTKGLNVRYKFLMTNGPPGEYWHEHLSADEFYVLPILMTFALVYMLVILSIVMCSVELKARQFLHSTYKLFIVSVGFQELGVMCQCIAYVRYALDGTGHPRIKYFGQLNEAASEICFLLLLLLLAKGYTVTRGRLRLGSSIKLTIFMCLYVVCFCCLFIYEREYFDPGEVLYLYESAPGYGLIALRIIAWWMFIYSTIFTLKHYPEKVTFYYPFNIVGTLWFVAGPIVVLAANSQIDKWVRESVVCGAIHVIAFCGHLLFMVLTLPAKANKNFPYHVRTNQIGMMEITGISGNSSIYQFGHHPYAPGASVGVGDVPFELFSVSRHLDIREKPIDFESQPYPHLVSTRYPQTILLPVTIKNMNDNISPESSGYSTPKITEEEPVVEQRDQITRRITADVGNVDMIVADDRKIYTTDCIKKDSKETPAVPIEEFTKVTISKRRPETASTVSLNTAQKAQETTALSLDKLTDMFAAQSHKKPSSN